MSSQWSSSSNRHNRMSSHKETCCNGTLGYARSDPHVTCSDMRCCNKSETVAVIPINDVLGFRFRCVPRVSVRPECYPAGTNVRSSNEDHDYTPRICCDGAKFAVLINKWYSAMTIRCVTRWRHHRQAEKKGEDMLTSSRVISITVSTDQWKNIIANTTTTTNAIATFDAIGT